MRTKKLCLLAVTIAVAVVTGSAVARAAEEKGKGNGNGVQKGKGKGGGKKDTNYKQPLFFEWEKGTLDVLIVPPDHGQLVNGNGLLNNGDPNELNPCTNSYVTAMKDAIADFDAAVTTFGSEGLQSNLVTNDYLVGCEPVPDEALQEPEIVIVTDETKAVILGVAVSFRAGEPRIEEVPCLVDNSKFFITSFTEVDMYNVGGQEYGHCLGLDHTEGGPKKDETLQDDIMFATYEQNPGDAGNHRQCPSNLNVMGLELVFGGLFGGPSGGTATLAPEEYKQISC